MLGLPLPLWYTISIAMLQSNFMILQEQDCIIYQYASLNQRWVAGYYTHSRWRYLPSDSSYSSGCLLLSQHLFELTLKIDHWIFNLFYIVSIHNWLACGGAGWAPGGAASLGFH